MSKESVEKKGTSDWLLVIACLCFLISAYIFSIFNPLNRYNLLDDGVRSELHYQNGKQFEEKGDKEMAKHDYRWALRYNPYHERANQALKKLNN